MMFTPDLTKSIFRVLASRSLLRGKLLVTRKLVMLTVYSVRIPGGLTPP
jgi:hypothetical protein